MTVPAAPTRFPITWVPLPEGTSGRLGLSCCPGLGPVGLADDCQSIADQGVFRVVSLNEPESRAQLGAANLKDCLAEQDVLWQEFPISNYGVPDADALRLLPGLLDELTFSLTTGKAVLLHCFAGLGRAGTVAALLLVELGLSGEEAIAHVRAYRPGAIESQSQEALIMNWRPSRGTLN